MIPVEFHEEAEEEYDYAYDRYLTVDRALARKFRDSVKKVVQRIKSGPHRYPVLEGRIHTCIVGNNFPFSVLYGYSEVKVIIVAVMHHRREPGYWKHRLDDIPPRMK